MDFKLLQQLTQYHKQYTPEQINTTIVNVVDTPTTGRIRPLLGGFWHPYRAHCISRACGTIFSTKKFFYIKNTYKYPYSKFQLKRIYISYIYIYVHALLTYIHISCYLDTFCTLTMPIKNGTTVYLSAVFLAKKGLSN